MYKIIKVHTPAIPMPTNVVKITALSTIPEELREAIRIVNCRLYVDTIDGIKVAPTGSIISFEKSEETSSGYDCRVVATPHTDLLNVNNVIFIKPTIMHAVLIPDKDEVRPLWAVRSKLTYNGDGTATLHTAEGDSTGRIGIDFLLCQDVKKAGNYKVSILSTYDEAYSEYILCDDDGKDIGKLVDFYPA